MKALGYGDLFYGYILCNKAPHSDWEGAESPRADNKLGVSPS